MPPSPRKSAASSRGRAPISLATPDADRLAAALVTPQRLPNPALVGRSALEIAAKVGITVPPSTRVLIAELAGVGRDYPLSIEKLCPVLSYYVVADWREGCERCIQILRYGGMGHTMSIHSRNEDVILEFGLKKPAFRIVVNTPTTHGSVGMTTGLDPAMTLGCGGYGGNITSDNIGPRHLLNIKRLAYETRPVNAADDRTCARAASTCAPPEGRGDAADARGGRVGDEAADRVVRGRFGGRSANRHAAASSESQSVAAFVCEDDVKEALKAGRKILVGERTIITPSARDLGEARRVFVPASWPRT